MGLLTKLKQVLFGSAVDHQALIAEGAIVVDVRSPKEYDSGHASKSINIPLNVLDKELDSLQGKKVVLVCRSGVRAGKARRILKESGIEAYNAGAWQNV